MNTGRGMQIGLRVKDQKATISYNILIIIRKVSNAVFFLCYCSFYQINLYSYDLIYSKNQLYFSGFTIYIYL